MPLKINRQMAEDLLGGMTEAAAVEKFCSSKGTLSLEELVYDFLNIYFINLISYFQNYCSVPPLWEVQL